MEVSLRLRIAPDTVRTWRRCFIEWGLDGLCDDPRPGVPRKITVPCTASPGSGVRNSSPSSTQKPRLTCRFT
ncbi:hypothetical protein OG295_39580 (plasmid) [Streptomyces sp. NBC_01276]